MQVKAEYIKELKVPLHLTLIAENEDDRKRIKEAKNLQIETVSCNYEKQLSMTIRIRIDNE